MQLFQVALLVALCARSGETQVAPPPRARAISNFGTFAGEVLAIDARSITIRGNEEEVQLAEKIVRYFPAGTALRNCEQELLEKSSSNYRLSDVKVGDNVYIMIHVYGADHLCVSVRITRRPGGVVPKAPFEEADAMHPYHEMMNAYQQFEEKGIPLPPKYNLEFQRLIRHARAAEDQACLDRWNERQKSEARIAPPPRSAPTEMRVPNFAPLRKKSNASQT